MKITITLMQRKTNLRLIEGLKRCLVSYWDLTLDRKVKMSCNCDRGKSEGMESH